MEPPELDRRRNLHDPGLRGKRPFLYSRAPLGRGPGGQVPGARFELQTRDPARGRRRRRLVQELDPTAAGGSEVITANRKA